MRDSRAKTKILLAYVIGQTLLLVLFYLPFLTGSASYYFRDLTHYNEPYARYVGDCLRNFVLPFWNPYCYCGMSQLGISVQGVCYPTTWLYGVLPFSSGLAVNMIVHQVLCGLGGFLLIWELSWGALPALLCAFALAMSGYEFCLSSIVSLVHTAAWCPLALWAILRISKIARPHTTSLSSDTVLSHDKCSLKIAGSELATATTIAALVVAFLVLAGHPELGLLECALIVMALAYQHWNHFRNERDGASSKSVLLLQLRALFIAGLLAMPAILPAFEWLSLSRRSGGLDPGEALILSANWYDLLGLCLWQPLGDMQQRWSEFRPLVMQGQMVPYVASAFVGPVLISLSALSLSDRQWKERWLVPALLVFVLLLCLGSNTPFVPFLLTMVKTSIRFPVKIIFFAVWCLAVMAARGLYMLIEKKSCDFLWASILWIFALLSGAGLLAGAHLLDPLLGYETLSSLQQALLRKAEPLLGISILTASALGGVTLVLAFVYTKNRKRFFLIPYLLLAVVAGSLLLHAFSFCRAGADGNFYNTPSLVAEKISRLRSANKVSSQARVLFLALEHFTIPNEYLVADSVEASIKSFQYSRQILRPNTNIDFKEPSSFGFEGSCTGDYYYLLHACYEKSSQAYGADAASADDRPLARFCRASASKFVITQVYRFARKPGEFVQIPLLSKSDFELAFEDVKMNVRIYMLRDDVQRVYLAKSWSSVDNHGEAINRYLDAGLSGFDPPNQIFLEPAENQGLQVAPGGSDKSVQSGLAEILHDDGNSVELAASSPTDCYLVLSDQFYPGWIAELDGKRCQIVQANSFARAIYLPAGKHKILFSFQPASFYLGLALAAVGVLWLCYLYFIAKRSKKHEEPADA